MSIVTDARRAFGNAVPYLDEEYSRISEAVRIYRGDAPWLRVKKSGLHSVGDRKMLSVNAAKAAADQFTALTLCEGADFYLSDPEYSDFLGRSLDESGFFSALPDFFSKAFMLGGGAVKISPSDGYAELEMCSADNFLPLSWNGRGVGEAVFRSRFAADGQFYTLLERRGFSGGSPSAEYHLFRNKNRWSAGSECDVSEIEGIPEEIRFEGADRQMFAYFRPSVSGIEDGSPLGRGILDFSADTLHALDIAFDSMSREFILGKKRIIVPYSCIRTVTDPETGNTKRYFDADDEAFIALKNEDNRDLNITDNTSELRIDEHVSAIKALLNILCFQLGISSEALAFDSIRGMKTIKTATEVISQDAKTARTVSLNRQLAAGFFTDMIRSVISMGICMGCLEKRPYTVKIGWKDGVITDDGTVISDNIRLVEAGLRSREHAVMEINKCDITAAQAELADIT